MELLNKMKWMWLVVAALACVSTAFAEVKTGSYAVVADDIASGAQITSVEGITMTFGASETWTSGVGKVVVDGTTFNVYASTGENCSPTNGAIPIVGPYVVFTPQFNGSVTSIVGNAGNNKNGFIVKDEDNNLINGTVFIDSVEVAWESGTPYNSAAKYYGGVTFEVEAGSTYYFYMAGSKMRFNGFIYTYEEVEAEPENPATEEVQLTIDIFKAWDGVGAGAQATGAANCELHVGEELGAGAMVYGTSTVYYLSYADLSAYSKMVIEGTPGVQLRVFLNRLVDEGQVADGNLTEVNVTIGEDGKATVDFSAYKFVHLNAIKTGWGSPKGTITKIYLEETDTLTPMVKTLVALLEQAIVWKGELNGSDEMHAQVIATLEQMIPAVQAVIDNPESEEAVEQMIADVKAMLGTYMPMIEQYDAKVLATLAIEAAQDLMASYTNYTDNAGLAKAIATAQNVLADLGMWDTMYTLEDLNAALNALIAAQEAFLVENADNSGIVDGVRQHPAATITFIAPATDNTPMYMYNVGAQKFFRGGNAWGAQTSVGDEGYKVYFEQYLTDGTWDGTTVYLRNYVENKGQIMDVFFDNSTGGCFVDRGSQSNYYWKLEKNAGNGYYRLSMAEVNPDYQAWQVEMHPNTYVGWDTANGTVVSAFLNPEVEGVHVDWAFVSEEGYSLFKDKLAIYNAAQTLKAEIDKAKALGLNVAAQEAVYLNMAATLAEVEKATSEVKDMLAAWEEGRVNPYSPVDKTSLIVNPSYDNNKNDGWSGTKPGFQSYGNAEHWNKTFDTYQDIANIPNGLYKMSVQGFFRPVTEGATGAVFYADNGTDRLTVDVPNVNSESELETKPNNMQSSGNAFAAGYYDTELFVNVTTGILRIGVALPQLTGNGDWVMWDNWRLTYYGNSVDVYDMFIDSLACKFDGREAEMTVGTIDSYKATLNALAVTDHVSFNAALISIDNAAVVVQANIDIWVKYADLINCGIKVRDNPNYTASTAMSLMTAYVDCQAPAILRDKVLSTEEVIMEIEKLDQMIEDAIYANVNDENPMDFTQLLKSPSFEDFNGMGSADGWAGATGALGSGGYEFYQEAFNLYQDLTGLPNGTYRLEVSAYERIGSYINDYKTYLTGADTATTYLYGQSGTAYYDTPVRRLASGAIVSDDGFGIDGMTIVGTAASGEAVQVPNTMASAAVMFNDYGEYLNVMYVEVTDGTLRIGMKKDVLSTYDWVMMDNWRLYYHGTNSLYAPDYVPSDKEYIPADVNGDGQISIVDVVTVANILMGTTMADFVFDAADMDQDGEITIVDVVAVVNTLMGSGEQEEAPQTAMDIQLETKDGQVIKNGSTVSIDAEMVDLALWGQVESNIYVRNLTEMDQGVYVSVKAVNGKSQICWGGACVSLSEGLSHTTSMGVVNANSSSNLLIETLIMAADYMNVPVNRTVEVTVWTDSKPDEKYTATVTYNYTPPYFDSDVRLVATRSNASILRSNLHVADAEVNAGETTTLYVKLDNAQAYTAMQMDMTLPEGLSIEGVEMVGNASHTVTYNEEGRIAAYSLANSRFHGGEALMAVTVKADEGFMGTANVDFTNVRVVSTDVVETVLADALSTVIGGAKSIDGVEADENVQILYYSTTGAVSDAPHKGLNIIKRIYEDGRVEVNKVMNR